MLSLLKSNRFQTEYKMFVEKINLVTDEQDKSQLNELLRQMINEVKKLDSYHEELTRSHMLPMGLDDSKHRLADYRKKIVKKLRDLNLYQA
jgi:two-component sensor histidine kinase